MAISWDKQPSSRITSTTRFALTTASQATAAFAGQTHQVRVATGNLVGSGVCYVKIGDGTPTADSTGSAILGSNVVDYFCVTPAKNALFQWKLRAALPP